MTPCLDTKGDGRACTRPAGHALPHSDDLGTWVHWHEYTPQDQAWMRANLDRAIDAAERSS